MKLQQLEYFVTLVTYMHYGKAAQALFLTQPALSKQIAQLEQDLGVKLIIRRYHSLELTNAGMLLNEEANHLLRNANYVASRLRTVESAIRRVLVGCDNIWVETRLAAAAEQLGSQLPAVKIDVQRRSYRVSLRRLASGMLDVFVYRSVSVSNPNYNMSNFQTEHLHQTKLCIVVHRNNPLSNRSSVDFRELRKERFAIYSVDEFPMPAEDFKKRCEQARFTPHVIGEYICTEDILHMVQNNGAVALLYDDIPLPTYPDLIRVPIANVEPANIYAIWNNENPNPDIEPFINLMRQL